MAYNYDIFLSYRRDNETRTWIGDHLVPLLSLRLGQVLDREPRVYLDTGLESGAFWPSQLADALGRSRILLVLWSGNYLSSEWCAQELSHMLDRERQSGVRTPKRPHGLVVPAFIHDGDNFPSTLRHIQYFQIQKCFNVRMVRNGERAEELDSILASEAPAIARCINAAPPWRSRWTKMAESNLYETLHRQARTQAGVPRFAE